MFRKLALAATGAAALSLTTVPALADSMTQPASDGVAIWDYAASENYCPAGLQPIMLGGAICCGTPNATGYQSHPVSAVRSVSARYDRIPMGKSPDSMDGS